MISQPRLFSQKPLYLTEEEAMALLEMCLLTSAAEESIHTEAIVRLSDLCREFLRKEEAPQKFVAPGNSARFRRAANLALA